MILDKKISPLEATSKADVETNKHSKLAFVVFLLSIISIKKCNIKAFGSDFID